MLLEITIIFLIFFVIKYITFAIIAPQSLFSLKRARVDLFLLIVAVAILGYSIQPSTYDDLYRHMQEVKIMYTKGFKVINENYRYLWSWRLILQFIALSKNEHFLPSFVSALNILFWILGIKVIAKIKSLSNLEFIVYFGITSGLEGWLAIFSGLRAALVCSIVGYLILKKIYSNKQWRWYDILLWIFAFFIHISAVIPFILFLINRIFIKFGISYFWILFMPLIFTKMQHLFKLFSVGYIQLYANKILAYANKIHPGLDMRLIYVNILFALVLCVIYFNSFRCNLYDEKNIEYKNYILSYSLLTISVIQTPVFVNRICIQLACIILPFIVMFRESKNRYMYIFLFVIFILGLNLYNIKYVSAYWSWK